MKTHYCVLEQDALLHISGPDSLTFLQGQTSCDTQTVNASQAVVGVYCNVQGRVVCDFLLCELGSEHFALRMRRGIRAGAAAVFGKYIIFSKAALEPARDDWQSVAVWGEGAKDALAASVKNLPNEQYSATSGDGFSIVQVDSAGTRFECMIDTAANSKLLDAIQENCEPGTEATWQAMDIQAGVARIEAQTVEEYVPQILNYDLTGHLNFKKGCYTGQEVVARLHYRGTPKRRSYLAVIETTEPPAAGTPLYSESAPGAQSVGNVINSAVWEDGVIALVAATSDGVAQGLHLQDPSSVSLCIGELPYAFEPA